MHTLIGEMIVEQEGEDNEERIAVVHITDSVSSEQEHCLDVYDMRNSLLYRVGYKKGMVEKDGVPFQGDTLIKQTVTQQKRVKECLIKCQLEVEHTH